MALDGPRLEPQSGSTKSVVVFLHGYGADGNDLIDLGRAWQQALPDTAFVSPHAPAPCGQSPMGKEWFALTFRDPDERWTGVNQTAPVLDAFLDAELKRTGLAPSRMALVGFSQGTMMALHVGLRRAEPLACIVGFSGMLALPRGGVDPLPIAKEIRSRPPVLLVHGDSDQVIPALALQYAAQALDDLDVPVKSYLRPGLGHGIDPEGLRRGGEFLAKHLAG